MSEGNMIVRPSYLPAATGAGQNDLQNYAKPAWIRIVQGNSKPPVKPPLKEADIYLTDSVTKIGDEQTPFDFFPLAFFPSWAITNPYGAESYIWKSTLDPLSDLAKECKLKPGKKELIEGVERKFVSFLNFVVLRPESPMPVMLAFKGGEYKYGQKFIGLINSQTTVHKVDMWLLKFRAASELHQYKAPNVGYGFDVRIHPDTFASEAECAFNCELAKKMQDLIAARQLEYAEADQGAADEPGVEF